MSSNNEEISITENIPSDNLIDEELREAEGEEEVRAPIPDTVDMLISAVQPLPTGESIENIDLISNLNKYEKFYFPYLYDIFCLSRDKDYSPKLTVFNWATKSGILPLTALFIQYLQVLSLTMLPSLIWSEQSLPFINALSFLRTFQLQFLFLPTYSETSVVADSDATWGSFQISQELGEWLNYYIPFFISLSYTLLLYFFFIVTLVKKLRKKWIVKIFHILMAILPMMYLPVLNGFFTTLFCYNYPIRLEVSIKNCFDWQHLYIAVISIILIIPFVVLTLIVTAFDFEWRPNTRDWNAKPHTRFSLIFVVFTMLMLLMTHVFELFSIFLLFTDFLVILIFICVHIYFLEWYQKLINQFVCSFLFVMLFGCMVSILLTSFKMMIPVLQHSFTVFPGLVFLCSILVATIIGTLLSQLRFRVIGLTVNSLTAPRIFQIFYRLQPDEIVVPKGDFEVEMAAKTAEVYSFSVDTLNQQEQDEIDVEELEDENEDDDVEDGIFDIEGENFNDKINDEGVRRKSARKLIEKVHTLYTNSLDVGMSSHYIALSYSLIHAFVMKDLKRSIQILVTQRGDKRIFWLDIKLMYYVRLRYYVEMEKSEELIRKKEEEIREKMRMEEIRKEEEEKEKTSLIEEDTTTITEEVIEM